MVAGTVKAAMVIGDSPLFTAEAIHALSHAEFLVVQDLFLNDLAQSADVTIQIFDMQGQIVRTLSFERLKVGYYDNRHRAAYWDGRNGLGEFVVSGIYYYRLTAGTYSGTRKLSIVR